jgi:hypothetical protein
MPALTREHSLFMRTAKRLRLKALNSAIHRFL